MPRAQMFDGLDGDTRAIDLLTIEQEQALFRRFNLARVEGDEATAQDCRERIARYNLPLALRFADRSNGKHISLADRFSAACEALARAINRYDTNRGYKFSTYACRAMINTVGREVHVQTERQYSRRGGGNGLPVLSLDKHEGDDPADPRDPIAEVDDRLDTEADLQHLLSLLDDREREVIRARFMQGKTLAQTGKRRGVTRERVRQIQAGALDKMRAAAGGGECTA